MSTHNQICLILSCICFGLGTFNIGGLNWLCGGFFFIILGNLL
jgi:hypothetical protein